MIARSLRLLWTVLLLTAGLFTALRLIPVRRRRRGVLTPAPDRLVGGPAGDPLAAPATAAQLSGPPGLASEGPPPVRRLSPVVVPPPSFASPAPAVDPSAESAEVAGQAVPEPGGTARHRRRAAAWGRGIATAAILVIGLGWLGWLLSGGSLFSVGSPSMGRTAPVGSLVLVRPLPAGSALHRGELVVFRPNGQGATPYVHRIYRVLSGGRFKTKGDLNTEPDPWIEQRSAILGRPAAVIPAIGWLYKCAAWLCLAGLILVILHAILPRGGRELIAPLAPSVLLSIPLLRYKPLMGGFVYSNGNHGRHIVARVVDTGILPVHFDPTGGPPVHAVPGQEVLVRGVARGGFHISVAAALPWWGWAVVGAVCLFPVGIELMRSRWPAESEEPLVSVSGPAYEVA